MIVDLCSEDEDDPVAATEPKAGKLSAALLERAEVVETETKAGGRAKAQGVPGLRVSGLAAIGLQQDLA
eukprot:CAMPEP_0119115292 /NCGR_PEP_ID=MMETSP1180-20130426/50477_1 /TAXON_ID=3052 ORGANISM="Chlamydomonas cf sp, Strain CCMP681" /NCGR_SAMPLE_ID=MMETSP1180 /ASSEMBLY_ACC=CAM_ASM_000741 /LENGTH=68 /DNA_ID=CAMNT_0007104199 /DNA_START=77 /DNA_END=279 /DNA_ORIENTATION=+